MLSKYAYIFFILSYFSLFAFSGRVKRVIGGVEVPCGTEPRVASIRNSTSSAHLCGSIVISPFAALTAAHCVQGPATDYKLQLNNYCTSVDEPIPTADVTKVIVHELYDKYSRAHDIVVLQVKINLEDLSWLKQSVLPASFFGLDGDLIVYGYGIQMVDTTETSEKLLAARVKVVSLSQCLRILGPYMAPMSGSGLLCALGDGVDACEGDSGGPLMGLDGVVEGISSHGQSCGAPGVPGIYTSVRAHKRWIQRILGEL